MSCKVCDELKAWLKNYDNREELAKKAELLNKNLIPWTDGISYMARSVLIKHEELLRFEEDRIKTILSAIDECEGKE